MGSGSFLDFRIFEITYFWLWILNMYQKLFGRMMFARDLQSIWSSWLSIRKSYSWLFSLSPSGNIRLSDSKITSITKISRITIQFCFGGFSWNSVVDVSSRIFTSLFAFLLVNVTVSSIQVFILFFRGQSSISLKAFSAVISTWNVLFWTKLVTFYEKNIEQHIHTPKTFQTRLVPTFDVKWRKLVNW